MPAALKPMIVGLVSGIEPTDDLGPAPKIYAWLHGALVSPGIWLR